MRQTAGQRSRLKDHKLVTSGEFSLSTMFSKVPTRECKLTKAIASVLYTP